MAAYPDQQAIQGLVTDIDNKEYDFHISNNRGLSSSIYDLALHKDIWPDVSFVETLKLQSITLPALLAQNKIDHGLFDCLVMDTQGSELLVLLGSGNLINQFKYILTEVSDFQLYKDCCQLDEMSSYLSMHGFREVHRKKIRMHPDGGGCYNILYQKT